MSLPAFFPDVQYVPAIDRSDAVPLHALCEQAGTKCEAFGAWTKRPVVIHAAGSGQPWLKAEPGGWGAVEIGVPPLGGQQEQARWALGVMAYVLFDGVARATVFGKEWSRIEKPKGKSGSKRPLTNAERQKRFRERKKTPSIFPE